MVKKALIEQGMKSRNLGYHRRCRRYYEDLSQIIATLNGTG